jgi:pimeloyl-ACP methyl ester carboxylesterase
MAAYIRFQRLLSRHYRVYFHDRAGYHLSERPPGSKPLTAQQNAQELRELLEVIGVKPPYILAGHSYGGIAARAFADKMGKGEVTGLVLLDTGTELMYALYEHIPDRNLLAVAKGVDLAEETDLRRQSKLTDSEWSTLEEAIERTTAQLKGDEDYHLSAFVLAESRQMEFHSMDPWPVCVVRGNIAIDFKIYYEVGVKRGQGTEEERRKAREFIGKWETFADELVAAQLRLTAREGMKRYVCRLDRDHQDLFRRPEDYVEEVRWVMERHKQHQER